MYDVSVLTVSEGHSMDNLPCEEGAPILTVRPCVRGREYQSNTNTL